VTWPDCTESGAELFGTPVAGFLAPDVGSTVRGPVTVERRGERTGPMTTEGRAGPPATLITAPVTGSLG